MTQKFSAPENALQPAHNDRAQPVDLTEQANLSAQAIGLVCRGLAPSSQRVYRHVYKLWAQWCHDHQVQPLDLSYDHVSAFLADRPGTKATKQRRLSALRQLVDTLAIVDYANPVWEALHKALGRIKIHHSESTGSERSTKALSVREVLASFDVWHQEKLTHVRNRALLAVLFYTGLRRSEAVSLQWANVDFANGLVTVQHGKGDQARTIPFASQDALPHLQRWQDLQASFGVERQYIFCSVKHKGDGELGPDKPMSTNAVYKVVKQSGDFAPHDARRTLITDMLSSGTSLPDAQFVAGHANGSTTMKYAKIKDAKDVRGRIKTSY